MAVTEEQIECAIAHLEGVEQLFSNETGNNTFRVWLEEQALAGSPRSLWIKDRMSICAAYIFDLTGFLEDTLDEMRKR